MATVHAGSGYTNICRISRDKFIAEAKLRLAPAVLKERDPGEYWDAIIEQNCDPCLILPIFIHESGGGRNGVATITHSWGNTRNPTFGVKKVKDISGADSPLVRSGTFPVFKSWLDGVISTAARLTTQNWYYGYEGRTIGQIFNDPVATNPSFSPQFAARSKDASGKIIPVEWAPAGDMNNPAGYLNSVLTMMNKIMDQEKPITPTSEPGVPMTVEDRFLSDLRARGRIATDLRKVLPLNKKYPYGLIPGSYGGVKSIACHWTGDSFTAETIRTITGTLYGTGGQISPQMTVDDEIDMAKWYAAYHITKDQGTWGGVAYHIFIFPSGRIYLNHNLNVMTYHAFNANSKCIAISCPNSNKAQPHQEQLVSWNEVVMWLTTECPEIPAAYKDVWGHKELTFYDTRNSGTECPGTFLPHIQKFRTTGTPTVTLNPVNPVPSGSNSDYDKDQAYKRNLLLEKADSMPFNIKGSIVQEGWFNLSSPPPGIEKGDRFERWIEFKSFRLHTINGRVESFALSGEGSFDSFKNLGMLGAW